MKASLSLLIAPLCAMVCAAVLVSSCAPAPPPTERLQSEPGFTGFITGIKPGASRSGGVLLVESHADKLVRRAAVTITKNTLIFVRDGESYREASFSDLRLQDQVQLWFTGTVEDSFAFEATAKQLLVAGHY